MTDARKTNDKVEERKEDASTSEQRPARAPLNVRTGLRAGDIQCWVPY